MTPESTAAEVFVSHPFSSMYFFSLQPERDNSPLPGPVSKGFHRTELPGEKSNLFWNKEKKDNGKM